MKRLLRSALAALMLAAALAAAPACFAGEPEVIDNKKTVLHKNFFDIPVAIVPKMGYNFEKIENGVVDKKKKVSLEGSLLHMSYSRLLDEISNDALKKGNMEVKSRYSFIWNGSRAELMKIFAEGHGATIGKWVLIVDRGADKCWMVSGSYNAKDMTSAQFVLDMIRSAWWENGAEESSGWPLYGGVDPEGTPFRLAGFRQDALIYTKDGKIPTQASDHALFVVSSAAREFIAPEKRAEFALREIKNVERGAELEIISQTEETIGGVPAVVITARTKDEARALIYQTALFHSQRVTMLVGIARGDADANLALFQRLAATYNESPTAKNDALRRLHLTARGGTAT
ncbi:hypothetical protein [Cloacibacillus sp. An23]|uniref:hypothetical protein n=1 Tax=Cloacibacillus sp. An23 TaxID=1965591 RepID=UPI000B369538|nr:hypothetical protein [Cloacibacillus sp. An23]OUO93303.1 hypothetical protein B5F39_08380 [Cloacibacillus sp. An23]